MATVGLKGLWGFEQLDKSAISTWKLSCCHQIVLADL